MDHTKNNLPPERGRWTVSPEGAQQDGGGDFIGKDSVTPSVALGGGTSSFQGEEKHPCIAPTLQGRLRLNQVISYLLAQTVR